MEKIISFDFIGEELLVFGDESVIQQTSSQQFGPAMLVEASLLLTGISLSEKKLRVKHRVLRYDEVLKVAIIRKKQWWAFWMAFVFIPLSISSAMSSFEQTSTLIFTLFFLLVLGIFPLSLFLSGRKFILILSEKQIIFFPADRKKRKVHEALSLLKRHLPEQVEWTPSLKNTI